LYQWAVKTVSKDESVISEAKGTNASDRLRIINREALDLKNKWVANPESEEAIKANQGLKEAKKQMKNASKERIDDPITRNKAVRAAIKQIYSSMSVLDAQGAHAIFSFVSEDGIWISEKNVGLGQGFNTKMKDRVF
jgi:hypothetical protein